MNITIEQAKEFIINTHPDPDNIYVTYRDIFGNSQIAVKERDLYSLMKQFANHCIEEYKESLKDKLNGLSEYCFADDYKVIDLPLEELIEKLEL